MFKLPRARLWCFAKNNWDFNILSNIIESFSCSQTTETHPNNNYLSSSRLFLFFLFTQFSRFLACPNKLNFFRDVMNIIDIIAIIPYFITLATVVAEEEDTLNLPKAPVSPQVARKLDSRKLFKFPTFFSFITLFLLIHPLVFLLSL